MTDSSKTPRGHFDLIIFDLDGTLIDSRLDIANAVNEALSQFGLQTWSVEEITSFIGRGTRVLIEKAINGKTELFEPVFACFSDRYQEKLLEHTKTYEGVEETLDWLSDRFLCVLSNKRQRYCDPIIDGLGLRKYFQRVLGGDFLSVQKPHPEPILHLVREIGVTKEKTVMIGDGVADIQAGKAAGVFTVALTGGFGAPEEMQSAGADWVVSNVCQTKNFL